MNYSFMMSGKCKKRWKIRNYLSEFSLETGLDKKEIKTEGISGKNIADGVEALIGAFFLSNNLYKTLKWLSDIRLVPME